MSTTDTNISKASMPTSQPQAESEEQTKATSEDVRNSRESSYDSNCTDSLLGRSRYGRTIKLKSANIANLSQVCCILFFVYVLD